ncbi:MAG: ankyrin repeat protein [Verrucomicrobiales bacterium]|jgi:ankyrin repeat protein
MPSQDRPKKMPKRKNKVSDRVGRVLLLIIGIGLIAATAWIVRYDLWKPEERLRLHLEKLGYSVEPTSVFQAIEKGDRSVFSKLQRCGVPLDARNSHGRTPLIEAVRIDSPEMITELLALGVSPTQTDFEARTPYSHAVELQNLHLIERFLNLGAEVNEPVIEGTPGLIHAIRSENLAMVQLFIDADADLTADSIAGGPLFSAITVGDERIVELLLTAGADPNALDPGGRPLAVAALDLERPDLARQLLNARAEPNAKGKGEVSLVQRAFENRDLELFDLAIRAGGDITEPTSDGNNLFELALLDLDQEWILLLLKHGADPNQRSVKENNPLWWEFFNEGNIEIAEQLLAAGADINSPDGGGYRPIDRALQIGNLRMVRYLLGRGAESESAGKNIWHPLLDQDYATMRILLGSGEDPNQPNSDEITPFGYALRTGDLTAAALLLEYGASYDSKAKVGGHTYLEWTLAWRFMPIADALIAAGADPNSRITHPPTAEFLKHFEGRGNLQFYLKNDKGLTPLMVGAGSGQYEMVTMLMDKGASKGVNTTKWESWPINFAVKAEDIRMSQILLGRDPDGEGKDRRIVINLDKQRAVFYERGEVKFSTRCSTGKKGHRTGAGVFVITDKNRLRRSNLYDANMPFFMRLSCSAIGMHQGNVPSYPASHGCVRLPYEYAKKFFAAAEVGDIVEIK